jgi:hypothetical protein
MTAVEAGSCHFAATGCHLALIAWSQIVGALPSAARVSSPPMFGKLDRKEFESSSSLNPSSHATAAISGRLPVSKRLRIHFTCSLIELALGAHQARSSYGFNMSSNSVL